MTKIETSLCHSDEVSGTWVMDDGTKCHWTEGRSSDIVCIRPDGSRLVIPAARMYDFVDQAPHLVNVLIEATHNGYDADERAMTQAEEAEHAAARS